MQKLLHKSVSIQIHIWIIALKHAFHCTKSFQSLRLFAIFESNF